MGDVAGVKHKVIGLVSGGKDSCFNLMHCLANGHELVAVANLTPAKGVDELDSHMYQSVGTQLLPYIAKAMGQPLYTGFIEGTAVEKGPEYGDRQRGGEGSGSAGDETEDLTRLLKTVMEAHPEATALASGAILSNYQRLRIEHVCSRLGLVSLAYLWQQPQLPLLESMMASEVDAILVKVAGVGLGVDTVGKTLRSNMPLLRRLERMYGSHPAGEGGEYETLTLSTPLFSHRLNIIKSSVIITDPEPYPVAYLKVDEAELEEKEGWAKPTVAELRAMLGLDDKGDGMDDTSRDLLESVGEMEKRDRGVGLESLQIQDSSVPMPIPTGVRFSRRGRWFAASVDGITNQGQGVGEELGACFEQLKATLEAQGLSLLHVAHITLLLSSMSLFVPANAVYTSYFGTSPPSRATVAVPLQPGQRVKLEVVGFDDHDRADKADKAVGGRQALHVQGLSYWAPANIGPYSQSVIVDSRVHVAGQIPLLPPSLTLPLDPAGTSAYPHQAVLALQHVRRITQVLRSRNSTGGGWTGWGESVVAWWARNGEAGGEGLDIVRKAWNLWADENGWEDVPALFVRASELPKGALVEYQVNMHTGRRVQGVEIPVDTPGSRSTEVDDEDEELEAGYTCISSGPVRWETSRTAGAVGRGSRAVVFFDRAEDVAAGLSLSGVLDILDRAVGVRVYHVPTVNLSKLDSTLQPIVKRASMTFVPVLDIHDRKGASAQVALDMFGV